LIFDLSAASVVRDGDANLTAEAVREESRSAEALLKELTSNMPEIIDLFEDPEDKEDGDTPLMDSLHYLKSAILLTGVHRVHEAIPLLHIWEPVDYVAGRCGSSTMRNKWWYEAQGLRPLVQQALRLLDVEPAGYASCHFSDLAGRRFPMPVRVSKRHELTGQIRSDMTPEQVLTLLGAPDHIRRHSVKVGAWYRSHEDWDYDFRTVDGWMTFGISWADEQKRCHITAMNWFPSDWYKNAGRESSFFLL
jgi:hypothetical protein